MVIQQLHQALKFEAAPGIPDTRLRCDLLHRGGQIRLIPGSSLEIKHNINSPSGSFLSLFTTFSHPQETAIVRVGDDQ